MFSFNFNWKPQNIGRDSNQSTYIDMEKKKLAKPKHRNQKIESEESDKVVEIEKVENHD